jgi:hypothetical protein
MRTLRYHAAKKCGQGTVGARKGGGACLGTRGQHWTSNGNIYILCAGARVMGVLMVIAACGEGVMYSCAPPPPRRIARLSPETRVRNVRLDFQYAICRSTRDGCLDGDCSLGGGG